MALSPRPARQARLSASVEKAFGELFSIEPMMPGDDPNARFIPDTGRDPITAEEPIVGKWHGPAKSMTPAGRGSASDDRAHNWNTVHPEIHFDDAKLPWPIQRGDVITRLLDATTWVANPTRPNGFGRTVVPLTSKKR